MPVLRSVRERFADDRPLAGLKLGVCLHVTAETANLARTLTAGGAEGGAVRGQPPVDAGRRRRGAGPRDAGAGQARDRPGPPARPRSRPWDPQITLDDGADLLTLLHERDALPDGFLGGDRGDDHRPGPRALAGPHVPRDRPQRGAHRARLQRPLRHPASRRSTASCGRRTCCWPGGPSSCSATASRDAGSPPGPGGAGAQVIICEVDPIAALEARMEGFEVMPSLQAAQRGDVFITVTGTPAVLGAEHFALMKDGATLANAGHFDVEIDLQALARGVERARTGPAARRDLRRRRPSPAPARPGPGRQPGRRPGPPGRDHGHLPSRSRRSPSEHLALHGDELAPGVHAAPAEIDREVARLKLAALGVAIDSLTPAQEAYRNSWTQAVRLPNERCPRRGRRQDARRRAALRRDRDVRALPPGAGGG